MSAVFAERPRHTVTTIVLLWAAVAGIALYWLSYFTEGQVHAAADLCYHVFERNFPLPDGFVLLCSAFAAEALRRRRASAVLWGLLAAGGYFFLGFIDIAFNLWNGMYRVHNAAMTAEIAINLFCLLFAGWLSAFLWRHRRALGV